VLDILQHEKANSETKTLKPKRPPTTRKIHTPKKRPLLPLTPLHLDPAGRTSRHLVVAIEREVEQGFLPGFGQFLELGEKRCTNRNFTVLADRLLLVFNNNRIRFLGLWKMIIPCQS
jgi:hypothetical protein